MPLPAPDHGEKRSKFMERCMSDHTTKGELKITNKEPPSVLLNFLRQKAKLHWY